MPRVASGSHGRAAGTCSVGSADLLHSEEQGELLCLRHEICLEMLGTEGERASSSSCSSVHSTLTLLPGRGQGGFAVVCDRMPGLRGPSCPVCSCLRAGSLGCTCVETSINVFLGGPSHA